MSNVAQKRPFASLVDDEPFDPTPPLSPFQPIPETDIMSPIETKWCSQTIKSLKKHKRAIAFLDPVDPVQFNIPDYFDIVKQPMDLGTIEKKLQAEEYLTINEFKSDVQLVFNNCYLYNHSDDPVCLDAKKLEEQYRKLCRKEPTTLEVSTLVNTTHSLPKNYTSPTTTTTAPPNIVKKSPSTLKVRLPVSALHRDSPHVYEDIKTPLESSSTDILKSTDQADIMPENHFKRCEAIVKELKKQKYEGLSWPFRNPVDAAAWGATDYYEIIKHPMDMTTYEKKLYNHEYVSEDELVEDIRLMFKNCYTYNPPDHLVHNLGKEFEQVFEKQWAKLLARSHKIMSSSSVKSMAKRRRTSSEDVIHQDSTLRKETEHKKKNTKIDLNDAEYMEDKELYQKKKEPVLKSSSHKKPTDSVDQNRPAILRLKIPTKPKVEDVPKPKPMTKAPNLALSKEPPVTMKKSNTEPDKALEDSLPPFHHQEKWTSVSKKVSPPRKSKDISTPLSTAAPKPKEPITPAAATFDINDLYNQIHNEKKIKEQKKREEQERWEKNERIRLEKEKLANEERIQQLREFNQHLQAQRQKDVKERLERLNACTVDISQQKLRFSKFELTHMARDQEWREIYTWQRETIDYRHIHVPAFVKRAPIPLSDLRRRLLSKCVRIQNSKFGNRPRSIVDDDGSDMDIE